MDSLVISQSDTKTNFSNWISKFIAVFDKHAPVMYKRVKRDTQLEWFNDDIKFAMKQRDKFHSRKDWNQYKYWRNKLTALLCTSKRNSFHDQLKKARITPFCGDKLKILMGKTMIGKHQTKV